MQPSPATRFALRRQSIQFSAVEKSISLLPPEYLKIKPPILSEPSGRTPSSRSPSTNLTPQSFNFKLSLNDIISGYSYTNLASFFTGGVYVIENAGAVSTTYSMNATGGSSLLLSLVFLVALAATSWAPLMFVPIATFSSMLVLLSAKCVETFVVKPYFEMSRKEWMIIPSFVILTIFVPVLPAVAIGGTVSVCLLIAALTNEGCVRSIANGMTLRSSIEYYRREERWLEEEGDRIQVLSLQSYLFFASSPSLLLYVEVRLGEGRVARSFV